MADGGVRAASNLTIPNALSGLRLASVPVFVWLFTSGYENAAILLYIAGAWTDFFDGYIARRLNQVTELGKLLDPLADRVFIVALALALVIRDALPLWVAGPVIGRDILIVPLFLVLERKGMERIPVNRVGKAATAFLLTGLSFLAWSETTLAGYRIADEIGLPLVIVGAVLYWLAAIMYGQEAGNRWKELSERREAAAGRES